MKIYKVSVPEVWYQDYYVKAESADEATLKVYNQESDVVLDEMSGFGFYLSHALERDTWDCAETTKEELPVIMK